MFDKQMLEMSRKYWDSITKAVLCDSSVSQAELGDALGYPTGAIRNACDKIAKYFRAKCVFMGSSGTTTFNAVFMTYVRRKYPGKLVLMSANPHKSVIDPAVDLFIPIRFIPIDYDQYFEAPIPPSPETVLSYVEQYEAPVVMITTPTYEGIKAKMDKIYNMIKKKYPDTVLYVDNAWGWGFDVPQSDIFVRSTHKMDGGLNSSSILVIKEDECLDMNLLRECVTARLTTSPSYPILLSIEAVYDIWANYKSFGKTLISWATEFKKEIEKHGIGEILSEKYIKDNYRKNISELDPRKIHIRLDKGTGFELSQKLQDLEIPIIPEKSGIRTITFIATARALYFDPAEIAYQIAKCYENLKKRDDLPTLPLTLNRYEELRRLEVYEVFHYGTRLIKSELAEGKISASVITPYPPGIPLIIPGMLIENDALQYLHTILKLGGEIVGCDPKLDVLRVVNIY